MFLHYSNYIFELPKFLSDVMVKNKNALNLRSYIYWPVKSSNTKLQFPALNWQHCGQFLFQNLPTKQSPDIWLIYFFKEDIVILSLVQKSLHQIRALAQSLSKQLAVI